MKTKKEKVIRNTLRIIFSIVIIGLAVNCPKLEAKAATYVEVQLPGKTWYNVAKRMVEDINAKRKANGVGELVLDADLQEWATQISAEMMFYPNALTSAYKADGEYLYSIATKPLGGMFQHLIAYSGGTEDGVFNNASVIYNIRYRMLLTDPSYKSIGIGLFQENFTANNYIYVMIMVGNNNNIKQGTYMPNTDETRGIRTLAENFKLCTGSDMNSAVEVHIDNIKLKSGKSETVQLTHHCTDGSHAPINNIQAVWASTNPSVASVNKHGTVTGLSKGTCMIKAELYGQTVFYTVTVTDDSKQETDNEPEVSKLKDLPKNYQGSAIVDGEEVYVKDQKKYSGTCKIDGKTYLYKNGKKFTGTKKGVYYKGGEKYTGWLKKGGKKYYYSKGKMVKNKFKTIKNKKYYFNKKGVMQKGQVKIKGKYYYFNKSGVMQKNKWIKVKGHKYYFNKKGVRTKKNPGI